MQSQGPKKVGSWRVPRELRWLQESFCSEGVLHEGGELHHESGPEDPSEDKPLRRSTQGSEAGSGRSSLKDTRGKSPGREGPSNEEGLCAPKSPTTQTKAVRSQARPIIFLDPDTMEPEEKPDSSWEEWDGEDGSSEGASSNGSDGEPHGCFEEL